MAEFAIGFTIIWFVLYMLNCMLAAAEGWDHVFYLPGIVLWILIIFGGMGYGIFKAAVHIGSKVLNG